MQQRIVKLSDALSRKKWQESIDLAMGIVGDLIKVMMFASNKL